MTTTGDRADRVGPTDGVLVAALAEPGAGRQHAWATLTRRHAGRLYAVARSFGVDEATAEDLVQTAWLRLLERGGQLRDPEAVGPWLSAIVRNEALRGLTRRRELPAEDAGADRHVDPDDLDAPGVRMVRDQDAAQVRSAFARLRDDCQQLLRLLLVDPPLSYDVIAVTVGRPRGSLGPTRRRCLEQLRAYLPAGFQP